ncbi:MAG: Fe-S cluster assembly dre2 [Lasallia pustulata]|uniref:Fe-S cluster assembly dre2 n=1 Tax=Lasallia pustulata TaxID=136370 RepID=A0A5M8PN16_9LECA|nr:MAG: Fe-S cluster assembly dre2 [Lasallia pustulata]
MAPSVTLDTASDFNPSPAMTSESTALPRTLLLSPPSLSSHPEKLDNVLEAHDRNTTDIQMLDRLSLSLVSLPDSTYDAVIVLSDVDATRSESQSLIHRDVLAKIVKALKPGGRLRSQDRAFARTEGVERTESILAGLMVHGSDGMVKPNYEATQTVPLKFGRKKSEGAAAAVTSAVGTGAVTLNLNGKRENGPPADTQPNGVGFVDFSDDFDAPMEEDDDELIDENTLLDEDDLSRPIMQPPECRPKAGKRRRACKDCTCGLAQKLEAEDAAKRADADAALSALSSAAKLKSDELAEVDFTVQGKVGSCGNCALGDAFRCDGCPYIGLPAFKPGEEVRLINDEVQL